MGEIKFIINDTELQPEIFLEMVQKVWRGDYNTEHTGEALKKTINITAWDETLLVGCIRILTDGYYFGTITELLVIPDYQRKGIGKKLMELACEASPTSLFFGAQPDAVGFYEKLAYSYGLQSFVFKKQTKV